MNQIIKWFYLLDVIFHSNKERGKWEHNRVKLAWSSERFDRKHSSEATFDIVMSACWVCPQWWNICKDPLMWHTIRMCYISISPYAYMDLWKICCFAIEL